MTSTTGHSTIRLRGGRREVGLGRGASETGVCRSDPSQLARPTIRAINGATQNTSLAATKQVASDDFSVGPRLSDDRRRPCPRRSGNRTAEQSAGSHRAHGEGTEITERSEQQARLVSSWMGRIADRDQWFLRVTDRSVLSGATPDCYAILRDLRVETIGLCGRGAAPAIDFAGSGSIKALADREELGG